MNITLFLKKHVYCELLSTIKVIVFYSFSYWSITAYFLFTSILQFMLSILGAERIPVSSTRVDP